MATATFRFHGELNDFLAPERRRAEFTATLARAASAKHMIEALGVPHTEVGAILVNGASVGFEHALADGDRVEAHPLRGQPDVHPLVCLRPELPSPPHFIADAHLGGLARLLRLAGFDTRYDNAIRDDDLVAIALREGRVVLSRDRELLKRRALMHACFVHALKPERQFAEIVWRLDLAAQARPFSLCLACNAPLRPVARAEVLERLPQRVRERQERFTTCDGCGRVFWAGSHWRAMRAVLAAAGLERSESEGDDV
jgi:hypothetical protein